jgi:hypothetical protein
MSDVVNTAADAISRGQNHCGAVAVSPCGKSAGAHRKVRIASRSRVCLWQHLEHVIVVRPAPPLPPPTPVVELVAMPEPAHLLVVADPQYGIHAPGQDQGQVVSAAPWRVLRLYGLRSPRCGPTRTSSPLPAAQHWRSSNAMSRTSPTPRPRPYLPMAEARGFSGAFR